VQERERKPFAAASHPVTRRRRLFVTIRTRTDSLGHSSGV
jgi:hypothetical protein